LQREEKRRGKRKERRIGERREPFIRLGFVVGKERKTALLKYFLPSSP
jgi:hypothetical protein